MKQALSRSRNPGYAAGTHNSATRRQWKFCQFNIENSSSFFSQGLHVLLIGYHAHWLRNPQKTLRRAYNFLPT